MVWKQKVPIVTRSVMAAADLSTEFGCDAQEVPAARAGGS
jgi:hypothetical protein